MYVSLCDFLCLVFFLSFVLGFSLFICLGFCFLGFFSFFFLSFFSFFCFFFLFFPIMWLAGSWCSGLGLGLSLWGGRAESRTLDHQRTPSPMELLISDSSPRGVRLNTKTQLHPSCTAGCYTAGYLHCWMPHTKQLARQEHNPTHWQTGCLKSYEAHRHPKTHHMLLRPAEWQDHAPPTRTQAPVPPARKPTLATGPTSPTGDRKQKYEELRTCSLQKGDPKHSKLNKMRRRRKHSSWRNKVKTHKTKQMKKYAVYLKKNSEWW